MGAGQPAQDTRIVEGAGGHSFYKKLQDVTHYRPRDDRASGTLCGSRRDGRWRCTHLALFVVKLREDWMIDRRDRDRAAHLVQQLRDGSVSNFAFEGNWPLGGSDRALNAISSMLWHYYDDLHEHTLTEAHALSGEARDLFDRCALFLLSDLEYLWQRDNFISDGFSTPRGWMELSGTCPQPDCEPVDASANSDISVWPFLTGAEHDQTRRTYIEGGEGGPV